MKFAKWTDDILRFFSIATSDQRAPHTVHSYPRKAIDGHMLDGKISTATSIFKIPHLKAMQFEASKSTKTSKTVP
ncbi:PseudoU_synth_2 domain-containing protein [Psidium guajava]|nr:PseudoU_synth_2 domain-containing protein [Psidium guajava]